MKRKIRTRKIWLVREENFLCLTCRATGTCADSKEKAKHDDKFYWDESYKKIVCLKCGHWLGDKKELEEQVEIKEIQQYGLYLRFVSKHFNPCEACQDKIHKQFKLCPMRLDYEYIKNQQMIDLLRGWNNSGGLWTLRLRFLNSTNDIQFCTKCSKRLDKTINEANELHIGNEVKPLVELWRKWEIVE